MTYDRFFAEALSKLHEEGRYRVFAELERIAGRCPFAIWQSPQGPRDVVIWARTTIWHEPASESG